MSAAPASGSARLRFPGVRAPRPLLDAAAEKRLTERQREILDDLEVAGGEEGFASLTMAEIAARMNCSLRTLYGIAPTRDELLLAVADRRLRRIGRRALDSLDPSLPPLELLRSYLHAAHRAVQPQTVNMTRDFAAVDGSEGLADVHENYVIAVVKSLLDRAATDGDIRDVDTAAIAQVLGRLGRAFARTDLAGKTRGNPEDSANAVADVILAGLVAS